MRKILPIGIALLLLMGLAVFVSALEFTDTDGSDFDLGSYVQTQTDGENLTIEWAGSSYYYHGNFTSRIFDAGSQAEWISVSWVETLLPLQLIEIRTRSGDTPTPDASWSDWTSLLQNGGDIPSGDSRYIQYWAFMTTTDNSTTPYLQSITLEYDLMDVLQVQLVSPQDNTITANPNVTFNCSATSSNQLVNITFYWNYSGTWESNETAALSGTSDHFEFVRKQLLDGSYIWNCLAADSAGSEFASQDYSISIVGGDLPPVIVGYNINPGVVGNNSDVGLYINASDDVGVDSVWADITLPDNNVITLALVNKGSVTYTATQIGTHSVFFYANDTIGNEVYVSDNFEVNAYVYFNASVIDSNQSGIDTDLTFYEKDTKNIVSEFSSSGGSFYDQVPEGEYDMLFSSFSGSFGVLLKGVDITSNLDQVFGMDKMDSPGEEYEQTFAVDNTYSISSSQLKLFYDTSIFNSSSVGLYVCGNWNFSGRECIDSYSLVTDFYHNSSGGYFRFNVSGFSAFSFKEEAHCGDGVCDSNENPSSCPQDCDCDDGDSQICGQSDKGECSLGNQDCVDGKWGPCIGEIPPEIDICNQKDDDCDGIIDNVDGGNSVISAKCECYNGGSPLVEEQCNNVDDDCNGLVDENLEKDCGSNIGICTQGTQTCSGGDWGSCLGGIKPADDEICDNDLDDNCNSIVDEACPSCTDGIMNSNEEGVDCGGSCPNDCIDFALIGIIIAVVGVAIVIIVFFFKFKKSPSWGDLEKKYSYKPRK
jgi:hypothetical protein